MKKEQAEFFGWPVRPADDAPGWESDTVRTPYGRKLVHQYRDPKSGEVVWIDTPPQASPDKDFYYIASGAQDVTADPWNKLWRTTKTRDEHLAPEGLARVREYPGKSTRSDPHSWPEPFKSEFIKGHPDWKGTGEPVKIRYWLPYWGLGHDEYWRQYWLEYGEHPHSAGDPPDGFEEFKKKHPRRD